MKVINASENSAGRFFLGMLGNFMKRALLAIICGAALLASSVAFAADPASDRDMADRYAQAAQSGDSDAQFYLGALYSSGVGRQLAEELRKTTPKPTCGLTSSRLAAGLMSSGTAAASSWVFSTAG